MTRPINSYGDIQLPYLPYLGILVNVLRATFCSNTLMHPEHTGLGNHAQIPREFRLEWRTRNPSTRAVDSNLHPGGRPSPL